MYIIIGGGGDVGYYLTKSLLSKGHEVLLLEKGASRYQSLSDELGQSVVRGDACFFGKLCVRTHTDPHDDQIAV